MASQVPSSGSLSRARKQIRGPTVSVPRGDRVDYRAWSSLPRRSGIKHHSNLYVVLVGNSSKARKGTSWSEVNRICEQIDLHWAKTRTQSGLTSGEGLSRCS